MAGLGRRSHYRKHLTDAVLHDLPEPDETLGQRIARVVGTRGGNMFDVVVAPASTSASSTDGKPQEDKKQDNDKNATKNSIKTSQLAFLPTKFRKLVWIKRNDFVIVECGDEEETEDQQSDKKEGGGFRYVISHILYKDQVKHIKSKGLWPTDSFFDDDVQSEGHQQPQQQQRTIPQDGQNNEEDENSENDSEQYQDDDGIVFDDPLSDELMVNTNRIAAMRVEDSSSDESSDDG
jgi:probable RNA-binding protein EIF1AD